MKSILSKDFLWNSIAGIVNALEVVIMSVVVTRYGRLADAGVLSLAFAVGNVLLTIGKYGVRVFQVTDAKDQYQFCIYLTQRFISVAIMLMSMICFLIIMYYPGEKQEAIIIISFIYMIESFEDCFWGHYQAKNRLYIGAQMFTTRWLVILTVFSIVMVCTHNMTESLFAGALLGLLIFLIWLIYFWRNEYIKESNYVPLQADKRALELIAALFRQTTPLFFATFCSIFISNLPKFVIDRYMSDEVQACYGFVAMPVFVIGLLNQFVYQPTVVRLTKEFHDGDFNLLRRDVHKQIVIVIGISVICVVGAGLIGIPVLSAIYHTDLHAYWKELVILQFAGGFLALSGYYTVLLTMIREQKRIMLGYFVAVILGVLCLGFLVRQAGTFGASIGFLMVMIMLFVFYFFSYERIIVKREGERINAV